MKETAVLYSGGTDSTCATVLMLEEFDRIHLITYKRFGLFCIQNTETNVNRLKEKFGQDRFIHRIIDIDKLFKETSYTKYWYNLRRYGFFLLSTCGLCKLAMHIRTLIYCLEHKIEYVCDGANKNAGSGYFPAQMPQVVDEIRQMYARYKIVYSVPVFGFDEQDNIGWLGKLGLKTPQLLNVEVDQEKPGVTNAEILFKMNFFPTQNIKGTKMDRQMQARCFQLILFNIFLYWYCLPAHGPQRYKETTAVFYKDKIEYFRRLIEEYLLKYKKSRLYNLIS